jgi:Tol biopolymer transport system component
MTRHRLQRLPSTFGLAFVATTMIMMPSSGAATHKPSDSTTPTVQTQDTDDQLVFSRYGDDGSTATLTVHADGSHELTIRDQTGDPNWSPDGRKIVITPCTDPELGPSCPEIIDPNGRLLQQLPIPLRFRQANPTFWQPAIWSPDGRRLAGSADSSDTSLNGIYTVRSSDGRGLTRVTSNPDGSDIPGAYSRNGTQIVFTRGNDESGTGIGVFVVHLDGSGLKQISPPGMEVADDPGLVDWSPDGRLIAFAGRPTPDNRFTLFTVRPNGTHLRRIPIPLPCGASFDDPHGVGCGTPAWSPDSRRLAFDVFDPNTDHQSIYLINANGTHLSQLTSGDFFDESPDWRPNTERCN